jgi:phage terminase Nu1 subunit (DNA packaging protein)
MRAQPTTAGRTQVASPVRGRNIPAEPYVDRKQLAKTMGVSVATIDRMVRAGMPSETWGLRSRRFQISAALAWAQARRADV